MRLLKLLSAGKSLDGSKPAASPYRMRTGNVLPKFGRKNPFAPPKREPLKPEANGAPEQMETDSLFESKPKPAPMPAPVAKAPVADETKPVATPEKKIESKLVAALPTARQTKSGVLSRLVGKLNPMGYVLKRRSQARSVRPKVARTVVQGELSLERVRVLRNELNDSDLEFVTAKPAAAGTGGTILPAAPLRLTTWGRLTSRMLSGVESQTQ